jgi:hypothetical protein
VVSITVLESIRFGANFLWRLTRLVSGALALSLIAAPALA